MDVDGFSVVAGTAILSLLPPLDVFDLLISIYALVPSSSFLFFFFFSFLTVHFQRAISITFLHFFVWRDVDELLKSEINQNDQAIGVCGGGFIFLFFFNFFFGERERSRFVP